MVQLHKEFINLIDEAEKAAVKQRRRRQDHFTLGDRLKPEAKEQLLALRQQLANN